MRKKRGKSCKGPVWEPAGFSGTSEQETINYAGDWDRKIERSDELRVRQLIVDHVMLEQITI